MYRLASITYLQSNIFLVEEQTLVITDFHVTAYQIIGKKGHVTAIE